VLVDGDASYTRVTPRLLHVPVRFLGARKGPRGNRAYGMGTALGCDIRIMAQSAKLAPAFVKRGIVPESGGTWYLPRLVGWSKAAEIIFTGRTLGAEECKELGLASRGARRRADAVRAQARRRHRCECAARGAVGEAAVRMGLAQQFDDHVHHVYLNFLQLMRTEDAKEGMASFAQKRAAEFKGR
jgi:enoyl-CoA hydratase/carnithine racemase